MPPVQAHWPSPRRTASSPSGRSTSQVEPGSVLVDSAASLPPRAPGRGHTAPTTGDRPLGAIDPRPPADERAPRPGSLCSAQVQLHGLPELLRVDEAAEFLRLTPAAVRQRICRGHLAALKLGPAPRDPTERDRRAVRIPRCALLAFLGLPVDSGPAQSDGLPVARRHCQGGS